MDFEEKNTVEADVYTGEADTKKKKKKEKIVYDEETVKAQEGKGTAAMVLGIIGVCLFLGPISFVCGLIALFLGVDANKRSNGTFGKAGKILGIISTIIWLLSFVVGAIILVITFVFPIIAFFLQMLMYTAYTA